MMTRQKSINEMDVIPMTEDHTMSKEHEKGKEKVKRLRDFYKRNFASGASDSAFLVWLEMMLAEIRKDENAGLFHTSPRDK